MDAAEVEQLRADNAQLRLENAQLKTLIHDLQARIEANSSTSHRPPSTDPPKDQTERNRRKRSRKKKGGQPGHKGHKRQLFEPSDVAITHNIVPDCCADCGTQLHGSDAEPWRHQLVELPPIKPHVTEWRLHTLQCNDCGQKTRAKMPGDVPASGFGPRLQACVATLTGHYLLSKAQAKDLLGDFASIPISTGSICNIEKRTAAALAPAYEEASSFIQQAAVVHMDETSWKMAGHTAWMWVATSGTVEVIAICDERTKDVAKDIAGEDFAGTLVTDRYGAYWWQVGSRHQFCWAHLLRDFAGMSKRSGLTGTLGAALENNARVVLDYGKRVRDGTWSRATLSEKIEAVKADVKRLLEVGDLFGSAPFGGMCRHILSKYDSLWTFVHVEGVETTNNAAERALRRGVLLRKKSGGNDSVQGAIFTERVLSVVGTLRRQGRNVLDFLTKTLTAALDGAQPPALIPASS